LAQGKAELKYQECLSSLLIDSASTPSSKPVFTLQDLRGKFSSVLTTASEAFVFCKDSSDLDLQFGRLRFCDLVKKRILEQLVDQHSRQIVFAGLLCADALFQKNLQSFLVDSKIDISAMTSKKSSVQRSLDIISSFVNASPADNRCDLATGLAALSRFVDDEIPPLSPPSTFERHVNFSEWTLNVLGEEWDARESKCLENEACWTEELQKCVTSVLKTYDRLMVESRSLLNPRVDVEMRRLKDQLVMAKKSITRAVELSDRAPPKTGSLSSLLTKAPAFFHTNPEKFDKLAKMVLAEAESN